MDIYIVDIIGAHSGTSYYNKSFREVLKTRFEKVGIISNYSDSESDSIAIFENYYHGNIVAKIFKLLKSLLKFYCFTLKNRKAIYVFQSFGNAYELLYIWPLTLTSLAIIDIHEVFSITDGMLKQNIVNRSAVIFTFRRLVNVVIVHSERTDELLDQINYKNLRLHIPHFSYELEPDNESKIISEEIKSLIHFDELNILFFGYLRLSKGVDTLISVARLAQSNDLKGKLNFIVAGNDPNNILNSLLKESGVESINNISAILRHISHEELKYLFAFSDVAFLPYKEISQSGVMEMAIHFRKPIVTSSISYFTKILSQFPSFGYHSDTENPEEFLRLFELFLVPKDSNRKVYYSDYDLSRFNEYKSPHKFLTDFINVVQMENNKRS